MQFHEILIFMAKTVRLKDIAEKAGVSISAVSKALQGSSEIPDETASKITKIANELGYHPNNSARSLRLGKSMRIGVIVPNNGYSYNQVLNGIDAAIRKYGYTSVLINSQDDPELEKSAIRELLSMPVDGIIAVPNYMSNYDSLRIPIVFISRYPYYPLPDVPSRPADESYVITNDYMGQKLAAAHMISCCGENQFLLLGSNDLNSVAGIKERIRLEGYRAALQEANLPYHPDRVIFGADSLTNAYALCMDLCQKAKPPFGLCVTNDYIAIGIMRAIYASGLRIPEDVSVIGFDDFDISEYLNPPLTTVHCSRYSLGSHAVHQIMDLLSNKGLKQTIRTVLQPELVIRSSTK